uniref:Nucleotide-sugar transporter n=1 Tax=Chloropicon primus TaxID=1764295 RepID=A0A7S2T4E9_9CHLO|mmetsp:Transcript_6444/g.19064  ORF Transcript_6444/g.19064 Transcript_6444/m.19064 type:complete len:308 (+) Transcript_6444:110-1033(+)
MAALAVQYGLQTHFQKKYLSKDVNKLGLILACEVIKLIIAMAALFVESMNGKPVNLFSRETARSVVLCSAPALIYVVQNFCVQTAYVELNPITFNCLNQTKLITTATALYLIKGVRQNKKQMLALSLVSVGAMLLSVRGSENGANAENMSTTTGVAMSLTGTVLSGIAATVTQIFMQDMRLSPFLVTLAMCIVSIVTVGSSIVSQTKIMGEPLLSVFDHWTASSIVPVITQALGGLLVGLVTNYCGSIDKGISFVCGLAVSAVCQCAVTRVMLPWNALLALLFVAQGSFMHTKESMLAKVRAKTKTQ